MKKFETVNLADYYSNNGSQYSTLGDITHYSAGGTRYDERDRNIKSQVRTRSQNQRDQTNFGNRQIHKSSQYKRRGE